MIEETISEIKKLVLKSDNVSIKKYLEQKEQIAHFRNKLANLVSAISEYDSFRKPVVIFIDELDRCKPDYSLLLLERMKHLLNIEGIVFILSIDRNQLENSIKTVYGRSYGS